MNEIDNIKRELKNIPSEQKMIEQISPLPKETEKQVLGALEIKGKEEYFGLRREWGYKILKCIMFLTLFQGFVILFIGCGIFNFTEYKSIILAFFIETFAQIVTLGYLVVNHLFPKI